MAHSQLDFPVSWEQLHRDARALAWRLAEQEPWQRIVAITRGGLVPAGRFLPGNGPLVDR